MDQYLRALRVCGTFEDRFISGLVYDITHESEDLPIEVLLTMPDNVIMHATAWAFSETPAVGGGSLRINIFEDPDITDPGTPLPMLSRNRINMVPPRVEPTLGPTRDADGELMYTAIVSPGGVEPLRRDLILSPGKSYLVTCERIGAVKHAFLLQIITMQGGKSGIEAILARRASTT